MKNFVKCLFAIIILYILAGYYNPILIKAESLPDFTVITAEYESATSWKFVVKNNGTKNAKNWKAKFEWLDKNGAVIDSLETGTYSDLAAGSALGGVFAPKGKGGYYPKESGYEFLANPPANAKKIRFTADPANTIKETNENNNFLAVDIPENPYALADLPDLKIESASYVSETDWKFVVKNNGTENAKNWNATFAWLDKNNDVIDSYKTPTHYGLLPGSTMGGVILPKQTSGFYKEEPGYKLLANPPANAKKLRLSIDQDNTITEKNEENNVFDIYAVTDLVVTSAVYAPEFWQLSFINQGNKAAHSVQVRISWLDKNGAPITSVDPMKELVKAGEVADYYSADYDKDSIFYKFLASPPQNAKMLRFHVDPNNMIEEFDENNNIVDVVILNPESTGEELAKEDEAMVLKDITLNVLYVNLATSTDKEDAEEKEQQIQEEMNPKIIPGSILYPFKSAWRETKSLVAFNSEKKANVRLQIAGQKILEINKLVDLGKTDVAAKYLGKYEKDIQKLDALIDTIGKKNETAAEGFRDKALQSEISHQVVIGKLERAAGDTNKPSIEEGRSKILESIAKNLTAVNDSERVQNIINRALKNDGAVLRPLRNLEVLKAVEEKVPKEAKDAIRQAQERSLQRLITHIEALPENRREILTNYIQNGGGSDSRYLEILEDARRRSMKEDTVFALDKAEEKVFERIRSNAERRNRPRPSESMLCVQEYKPVCGADRRTYSNRCVAEEQNRVTVLYEGECRSETTPTSETRNSNTRNTTNNATCPETVEAVCGTDGKTYRNRCIAEQAQTQIRYQGVCR